MSHIENIGPLGVDRVAAELRAMDDGRVQAQDLVQKAALHALITLRRIGVTEANVEAMVMSLQEYATVIATELRRRGMNPTDLPGSH